MRIRQTVSKVIVCAKATLFGLGPPVIQRRVTTKDTYRQVLLTANTASSSSSYKISTIPMEPCTYKPVMLTSVTSRFLHARKRLKKISERLKLWVSSHILVYPHLLQVQGVSSESMSSTLADPLLTRHGSITCQPSGINSADHHDLDLPPSEPHPDPHCHVQNDGDECRDEEIPEEDF